MTIPEDLKISDNHYKLFAFISFKFEEMDKDNDFENGYFYSIFNKNDKWFMVEKEEIFEVGKEFVQSKMCPVIILYK
jgi:hypothetical protein